MTSDQKSIQAVTSPSSEQAERLKLGLAIAQTAYELNNGHRIVPGKTLSYFDDAALINTPGARPLKLPIDESFLVKGVFNDPKTGLNAFLAYSSDRKEILIGVAGTNGFGGDAPDTKQDLISLGIGQAKALAENRDFQVALQSIFVSENNPSDVKILIGGQSLGGGIAPTLGMFLVYGNPKANHELFYSQLQIKANQISAVSINGFGNEYPAQFAGFSPEKIREFNEQADLNRLVVFNKITGQYDLVSQFGGSFSGTNWILEVEISRSLAELHRVNFGVTEGIDNVYGDLTRIRSGQVPVVNHKTLAENAYRLDSMLPIANNTLSLSWAGYVSLLFSMPGEGAASMSAGLQSYTGLSKGLADVVGAIGEFVLRALPVARGAEVMQFLFGSYVGGQLIGSRDSAVPAFDVIGTFGPAQEGWIRKVMSEASSGVPVAVIDINPLTRISAIKQRDGRSVETHPDGTVIQTHPEFGIAVIHPDGSGMLFLKSVDNTSGELLTSTVVLDPGSKSVLKDVGWTVEQLLDESTNLYRLTEYHGVDAEILEARLAPGDGQLITFNPTKVLKTKLTANNLTLPDGPQIQQSTIAIGPGHIQIVFRDDDRRTIQTVDIATTDDSSTSTYKDGQGNIQKIIKEEHLNADTVRTIETDDSGKLIKSNLVRRYRSNGELFELEDSIDEEGVRIVTVRDSDGSTKKAERVPLEGTPSEYYAETVRDELHADIADFLTALRQKDTAGIILSTARIALDHARSQGVATLAYDTAVADASSALALVSSLRSLRSGDTLAKVGGAVGLLNSTNYFAARLTGSGYLTSAQSAVLSQIGAALAIYNLTNLGKMVESGQLGSAGATVISAVNAAGYLTGTSSALMGSGALIAVNPIVMVGVALLADVLFGEDPPPPPPKGTATFYRDDHGALAYRITESNKLGEKILKRELDELLPALQQKLITANEQCTDDQHKLTLIASRMPTIQISGWPTWGDNGVDNYFFVMTQQDPMRDDPAYAAVSRMDLVKLYPETMLLPEAVVQQWEVDHLRQKFGSDEAHWQTEGEWLRGVSPTERERSRLQQAADQALTRWKNAAELNLQLTDADRFRSDGDGNVAVQDTINAEIEVLRLAMDAAKSAADTFNAQHPVNPLEAAEASAVQEAAFALARGARETVALQWMQLIVVDLGNDGVEMIDLPGTVGTDLTSLRTQRVARFDVDGDGFREATQWIAPTDAILGIDRSGNNVLDSGSELFNGADTPFDQHGIASLGFYDANGDGLITREDPVYRQLRLWVDLDGDGSSGELEVFDLQMRAVALQASDRVDPDLAAMVVDAIDLAGATLRFADGSKAAMKQLSLLSHLQGLQIVSDPTTQNLNVLHEQGLRENFVTLVDDMSVLQELQSPDLPTARRNELEALAARYGLNPKSAEFSSMVQSMRAVGETIGNQETVIYFRDDDVWVDSTIREKFEQLRISFRRLTDSVTDKPAGSGASGSSSGSNSLYGPQVIHIGSAPKTEQLTTAGRFDDRWVPSRRVGAADIHSDAPATPTEFIPLEEKPALPDDVYSLMAVTKGAQVGDLVRQLAVTLSDSKREGALRPAMSFVFSTAKPVATLGAVTLDADEDSAVSTSYQSLVQAGERVLSSHGIDVRLRLVGIRSASHGTVDMNDQTSRIGFQPETDFTGDAGFTYVLADPQGQIYEQTVSIRLRAINDAPRVAGESITASEDVPLLIDPLALLANDHDVDDDPLQVTGIARVALGRAELLGNGQIHYTPPSDQYGITDTLEYIVQDSQGASAIARIRISLNAVDDAPSVVTERIIHAREDQPLRINSRLLLRNDFDVDTDARIGSLPLRVTAVGSATHGKVRMDAGNDIVFDADADFNGEASFSYTVMDESGLATTGRALVRIDAVNDAPIAVGEHIASLEDAPLLIDPTLLLKNELDTDIERGERQMLSVVAVGDAVGGKVALVDGSIRFIPEVDRVGQGSFSYTVSDGAGGFDRATVKIDLAEVNDAPVLPALAFNVLEDNELVISAAQLLRGATDADDDVATLKVVRISQTFGGTGALVDGELRFRPDANFAGLGSVAFVVADPHGTEAIGIASIDVNGINDAPMLLPGSHINLAGLEDQEIRIAESALIKMYWDADGDAIRLDPQSLKAAQPGDIVRFDIDKRELVFRGAPDANGLREFSLAMTDGQLSSTVQALSVNLEAVNDAPVANVVGFLMLEDGGEINPTKSAWTYLSHELLLSGARDPEGDRLAVIGVSNARTSVTNRPEPVEILNDPSTGRIALRAPLNYNGVIEFEFTVSDAKGGTVTQKAYGMVTAVNDAPYLSAVQTSPPKRHVTLHIAGNITEDRSTWEIEAWDPDANVATRITVERNPLRGKVTLGKPSSAPDPRGGMMTKASVTVGSGSGTVKTTETAWFLGTDASGASAPVDISFTALHSSDPIVIDLGRDGLRFIDIEQSQARFDVDGVSRRSAWIGAEEGILAYDANQDGRIDRLDEIAFGSHIGQPAASDLQALQDARFDRNQDAVLDAQDPAWQQFLVWRDLNGNGRSDAGELQGLDEAGIRGLYLNANVLNRSEGPDVRVRGYTRVMMQDGSLLQAADVWLGLEHPDATQGAAPLPTMQQASQLGTDQLERLLQQLADAPREGNRAPMVYGYLPTQFADAEQPFHLMLAPNFFIDADALDPLQIDVRLADGSALPSWLRWDPERLLLEGIPAATDEGHLDLALVATDQHGASTQTSFDLVIGAAAAVPTTTTSIADDELLPVDLALSSLLSAVASGSSTTSAASAFNLADFVPPVDGIDLLAGFRTATSDAVPEGAFMSERAAAEGGAAWAGPMAGGALPAWTTPDNVTPWRSQGSQTAFA